MKKLTLDLDTISVQSFETAVLDVSLGTVHGQAISWDTFGAHCPTKCSCPNTQ